MKSIQRVKLFALFALAALAACSSRESRSDSVVATTPPGAVAPQAGADSGRRDVAVHSGASTRATPSGAPAKPASPPTTTAPRADSTRGAGSRPATTGNVASATGTTGAPRASGATAAVGGASSTASNAPSPSSTGGAAPPPATHAETVAEDPATLFKRALDSLPFHRGEKLEYDVKYGFLGVGRATLEVLGTDEVRGKPVVHTVFAVNGGVRVYKVDDRYESWFDPRSFTALRFSQHIDEGSYERERLYEIFPDRATFRENDKPEEPSVAEPLDEGSLIYYLRLLPLEVGKTYELNRYFRPDRNPVRVIVLRKEQNVRVPAGTFNTIVVRPVIKAKGIFSEGGKAQAWLTDDSSRTLVQLKTDLKFGSLNLYLKRRTTGTGW